jgi:hypothetical protein
LIKAPGPLGAQSADDLELSKNKKTKSFDSTNKQISTINGNMKKTVNNYKSTAGPGKSKMSSSLGNLGMLTQDPYCDAHSSVGKVFSLLSQVR